MTKQARIEARGGDLYVTAPSGYQYRRVSGQWQMCGDSGAWFDCNIHALSTRNQVADYECCLRAYSFEEGPDYPKGRKKMEPVGDFIRRLQIQELRACTKNIFAHVNMRYNYRPSVPPISRLLKPMPADTPWVGD